MSRSHKNKEACKAVLFVFIVCSYEENLLECMHSNMFCGVARERLQRTIRKTRFRIL